MGGRTHTQISEEGGNKFNCELPYANAHRGKLLWMRCPKGVWELEGVVRGKETVMRCVIQKTGDRDR